ncbi:MAG: YeeE/YedE family protein [Anaerolineales bacterium]|nr:YeeE/YedE family protein [Anaerolineales bacterium]
MFEWLLQPWPWYISGPLIGLTVPLLLVLSGKSFGISSSLRYIGCAIVPRSKLAYLRSITWRQHSWNLIFVLGVAIGGFVASHFLSAAPVSFLPDSYQSVTGVIALAIGGILIGFGTRYANGCTSGHTIMGLSLLSWPSLVASVFFFVGGLLSTNLIVRWLFAG